MNSISAFQNALIRWYERNKRDLPWRRTVDPYAIWLSEIMLQQTRVAAVIPYYERFLRRFPTPAGLAKAAEAEVLSMWAGLGYYSRARNLQKAAREIQAQGSFPKSYDAIRALPGVGDYTAAAVASIAFGLPHAVLDGNAARVLARLDDDGSDIKASPVRRRLQARAQELLDRKRPSLFNQALMELGATVCLPRQPLCAACPVAKMCLALEAGTHNELPVKGGQTAVHYVERIVVIVRKRESILMWRRGQDEPRLKGFWELPEPHMLPGVRLAEPLGEFRHSITNHRWFRWVSLKENARIPLSTTTRKALAVLRRTEEKNPPGKGPPQRRRVVVD
ncbi:MAG: A/G-specific adenine glycosylase [Candidatus Solibacter usitatus]|nr:A/G-specific adenine glycosylase [Candidatus Solibacter usitatus]